MKKKVLLLIIYFALTASIIFSSEQKTSFKKNFIAIDFIGGFSFTTFLDLGGAFGLNIGYLRAVNDYFAFGPGVNGLFSIVAMRYYDDNLNETISPYYLFSGGLALLKLMIGNFKQSNFAFLFDIGFGWLFGVYMGLLYKNFSFKIGYQMTYLVIGHHFTASIGFKLNFGKDI